MWPTLAASLLGVIVAAFDDERAAGEWLEPVPHWVFVCVHRYKPYQKGDVFDTYHAVRVRFPKCPPSVTFTHPIPEYWRTALEMKILNLLFPASEGGFDAGKKVGQNAGEPVVSARKLSTQYKRVDYVEFVGMFEGGQFLEPMRDETGLRGFKEPFLDDDLFHSLGLPCLVKLYVTAKDVGYSAKKWTHYSAEMDTDELKEWARDPFNFERDHNSMFPVVSYYTIERRFAIVDPERDLMKNAYWNRSTYIIARDRLKK